MEDLYGQSELPTGIIQYKVLTTNCCRLFELAIDIAVFMVSLIPSSNQKGVAT